MPKIKTPYFILIGILAAACQVGLTQMESKTAINPPENQNISLSEEAQFMDMDRSDPYGKFPDIR